MIVAHRILLFPNNAQERFFRKASGTARFVFNWGLAEWKRQYDVGENPSAYALKKQFNEIQNSQFPWVAEVNSHAKQQAFADLGKAFKNFFRRVKQGGEKPGYPKFKSKGRSRDSFYMANIECAISGNQLRLPKKMGDVRMRETMRYHGKLMSVRISREIDRWYAAISIEIPDQKPQDLQGRMPVGVNLGVHRMATASTGLMLDEPKHGEPAQRRLKILQRQIRPGKHRPGSRRYKIAAKRVAKQHQRIRHLRENSLHQVSANLTQRYPLMAIEGWSVKALTASAAGTPEKPGENVALKSKFNRHMLDRGIGELRRQIEYKAARRGGMVIVHDEHEITNRTCSRCGHIHPQQPLLVPVYKCQACDLVLDRDTNSALVIAQKATGGAPGSNARGVAQSGSSDPSRHDETGTRQWSDQR